MNENISRLMDGELGDAEFERCCGELKSADAMHTWVCYHVIGDTLRGTVRHSTSFEARFAARLAEEPTVLAPKARPPAPARPATFAWAVAATVAAVSVVGYTAVSMMDAPPTALAKAREAATVRQAQVTPPAAVGADYLLAHQEYAPAFAMQSGTYLRAVATAPGVVPPPPATSPAPAAAEAPATTR
ncbi:MAG: sigma-E factor negative regulatory protein [Burkholderiales bacterium]